MRLSITREERALLARLLQTEKDDPETEQAYYVADDLLEKLGRAS